MRNPGAVVGIPDKQFSVLHTDADIGLGRLLLQRIPGQCLENITEHRIRKDVHRADVRCQFQRPRRLRNTCGKLLPYRCGSGDAFLNIGEFFDIIKILPGLRTDRTSVGFYLLLEPEDIVLNGIGDGPDLIVGLHAAVSDG